MNDEVSPWIFLDTRFNINHAEYTWDDGTKIELEEWLNVRGPIGTDFVPLSPGNPYIPKWIILRYFKDVMLLFKLSRAVQNNDPCEIERPMIPACFTSRFKLIVTKNVALSRLKPVYQYDYESNTNCLNQERAELSVCFEHHYYCESDLIDVNTDTSFLQVTGPISLIQGFDEQSSSHRED